MVALHGFWHFCNFFNFFCNSFDSSWLYRLAVTPAAFSARASCSPPIFCGGKAVAGKPFGEGLTPPFSPSIWIRTCKKAHFRAARKCICPLPGERKQVRESLPRQGVRASLHHQLRSNVKELTDHPGKSRGRRTGHGQTVIIH